MTQSPASSPLDQRLELAHLPTPVLALDRLARHIGMQPGFLFAKLDDTTGLAGGGNKVRKLEYLCADALAEGCDTLVTGGGAQSNHARLTAAAARRLGLECTLVLGGPAPDVASGNLLLDELFGAQIIWTPEYGFAAVEGEILAACDALRARGRRPYRIPIGGSTPLGALGYVRCAQELTHQVPGIEVVVVASGSGGTHAGLAAGFGDHRRVRGVDVGARPGIREYVQTLAAETASLAGWSSPHGEAVVDTSQVGAAYGAYTEACREAIRLGARLEGLVLDPVYTGKALAGLIAARAANDIDASTRTVFVHTGGLPSVFTPANAAWVTAHGRVGDRRGGGRIGE